MKKIFGISTIGAVVMASAILAAGCSRGKKETASPVVPVLTAKAVSTNMPVQIQPTPVGHVMAYSSVQIRSQIAGILSDAHFREGEEVKSNALLIRIDPRSMEAALARDQAQLENATLQFNRDQKLFEAKIESQDQFDVSRANRDTLAATVQTDELNLSFTEIHAPFDGIAGALQKHPGDIIKAPDDILLTLNQIHPIYVAFAVPERYLPEIQKEMREHKLHAEAFFENMNIPPPQGELTFVDNAVDTTTGTIQLRATFPNENNVLWPGQFVRIALTLSDITGALVVPTQAVQTGQNGQFIYVVKPDQTAEKRPVKIGVEYNGETIVENGLKEGETVVTDGQLRLVPGVSVSVKSSSGSTTNSTVN